jgi:CRP-like cAMP-binding protein
LRQAKTCARNIAASFRGEKQTRFAFTGLGKLGSLGRRSAVAEVFGFRFKGLIAWLLWRGVYVTKFPGLDGQLRLIVDWILDTFLPRDITQLRLFHDEAVHREHFEKGEEVFACGDFGDKVYFVVNGEATVERDGVQLAKLGCGDVFGEAALISNQPRNATIRAITSLDTVAVTRGAFQELLMHLPGLHETMQELMSGRIKQGENLISMMEHAAARDREDVTQEVPLENISKWLPAVSRSHRASFWQYATRLYCFEERGHPSIPACWRVPSSMTPQPGQTEPVPGGHTRRSTGIFSSFLSVVLRQHTERHISGSAPIPKSVSTRRPSRRSALRNPRVNQLSR